MPSIIQLTAKDMKQAKWKQTNEEIQWNSISARDVSRDKTKE